MKRVVVSCFRALGLAVLLAVTAAPALAAGIDSATKGGWVLYYDESWNVIGEWYKPCSGAMTRWGVTSPNYEIVDYWDCGGGPEPPECTPTITHDTPWGEGLPNPSLVCGTGS